MDIHLVSNVLNKIAARYYAASGRECVEILGLSRYLHAQSAHAVPGSVSYAAEVSVFRSYLQLLGSCHDCTILFNFDAEDSLTSLELPAGFFSQVTRTVLRYTEVGVPAMRQVGLKVAAHGLCLDLNFKFDQSCEALGGHDGQAAWVTDLKQALEKITSGIWQTRVDAHELSVSWWHR